MKIKFKKLHPDAIIPHFALPGDAGMDLYAVETVTLKPGERSVIPIGLAMEFPRGYVALFWDKSGIATKQGLTTLAGVVDSGYRGPLMVPMINLSDKEYTFEKGKKVAQMLVQPIEEPQIEEVEELSDSDRGEAGFGSTGI